MKKVLLEKIDAAEIPFYKTPSFDEYHSGSQKTTVPIGYSIEGYLESEPVIGSCIWIQRTLPESNEVIGLAHTSVVENIVLTIDKTFIYTNNSIYQLTEMRS